MALSATRETFVRALDTQARVVWAIALRKIATELGSSPGSVVMMFVRPSLLVILMTVTMYYAHFLAPQGMSIIAFSVTGWLPWFAFHRTFANLSREESGGSILLFPQISPLAGHIANLIYQWLIYTVVFIIFSCAALLFERSPPPADPLRVISTFWTLQFLGSNLGLFFTSLARIFPVILEFNLILRRLGAFISGVAVTAADTPSSLLNIMKWNPAFQCFEIMREAWWPAYVSPIANPTYVMQFTFYSLAIGLAMERFTRRFIET